MFISVKGIPCLMRTRDVLIIAAAAVLIVLLCSFAIHDNSGKEPDSGYIGIIGAMDVEVDGLKELMDVEEIEIVAGMEFYKGTLHGDKIVVVKCGMGKVNAGICAQTLISDFNVSCVINTGVAGCLDDELDIGDIVISTAALQHDFDVTPLGFKKGEIPYTGLIRFEADMDLVKKLHHAINVSIVGIKVKEGVVCTGDQFINTVEQKNRILNDFGDGLCCEMEGGAIAQVCYLNSVPFVILRCLSDDAEGSAPEDYPAFERMAAQRNIVVLEHLLKEF